MSLDKVLRFSIEEIARKKKQFFFSLLLLVFGIILTGAAMYLYSATRYNEKICDDALTYGNAGTYYMRASTKLESNGANEEFIKDMRAVEGLCNFGEFDCGKVEAEGDFEMLLLMQRDVPYVDGETDYFRVCANADAVGICDVKLKDGKSIENPPKYTCYLYLGEELSSIPIGTELKMYPDSKFKMVVKGYIEPNQIFVNHNIPITGYTLDTYYYNLDKLLLMVEGNDEITDRGDYFFSIQEGADKDKVLSDVNAVLKKHELNYYVDNFEYSFEKRSLADKNTADMLMQLAVVVIIAVVFIQICMQSSDVISNSKKYGIMYANGFTKSDIRKIICVQNVIKLVIALVLAIMLGYFVIVYNNDGLAPVATYNMIFVLRKYVVLKLVLISTAIMAVGTVVPLLVLESMPPVKLMKAKR